MGWGESRELCSGLQLWLQLWLRLWLWLQMQLRLRLRLRLRLGCGLQSGLGLGLGPDVSFRRLWHPSRFLLRRDWGLGLRLRS